MPGYVWCDCSVCSQHSAGSTRQMAITAQRHREQEEQTSQAQISNTGLPQAFATPSGCIPDGPDTGISMLGANAQVQPPNPDQYSPQGGTQFESGPDDFDDEYDEGLVDDESDFDA